MHERNAETTQYMCSKLRSKQLSVKPRSSKPQEAEIIPYWVKLGQRRQHRPQAKQETDNQGDVEIA
jgi:hypothetical protein